MSKTPTELLNFLASYHSPEIFHTILAKDVFPLLDTLPETTKDNLIKTLTDLAAKAGHVKTKVSKPQSLDNSRLIRVDVASSYVQKSDRRTGLVAYDEVTHSVSKGIKDLLMDVKNDWKNGYEEQVRLNSKKHSHHACCEYSQTDATLRAGRNDGKNRERIASVAA